VRAERGAAAVELAAGVAFLVLPALLLAVSFLPWLETELEATRVAVFVARHVAFDEVPMPPIPAGSSITVSRTDGALGVVIRVDVRLPVAAVDAPWGPIGPGWASSSHVEVVGWYRSRP
jgi:hypothetical protein